MPTDDQTDDRMIDRLADAIDPASGHYATLERELGRLVRRVQAHGRDLAREVHPDLDLAEYRVLVWLDEQESRQESRAEECRAARVAAYFGIDKSAVSRQVGRLERLGLIIRGPDPADARAQRLLLTEDGRRRLHRVRDARRRLFHALLASWGAEEVSRFAQQLCRFNELYALTD